MKIAQSCLTLCDPVDCSLPGSSVQARILKYLLLSPGESSQPRDQTQVSCITGRFSTIWVTREALPFQEHYPRIFLVYKQQRTITSFHSASQKKYLWWHSNIKHYLKIHEDKLDFFTLLKKILPWTRERISDPCLGQSNISDQWAGFCAWG